MDTGFLDTKASFEEIMRRYYSRLLYYARSVTGNDFTAQDVVQETFIAAYKAYGDYSERGKVFSWLKAIARNIAYRHMARESKYICVSFSESVYDEDGGEMNLAGYIADDASIEAELVADEGYQTILEIIHRLPEPQRAVCFCRFVEGMSVSEAAEKLNIPQGSVKSKTYYGRARIQSELNDRI
jgi:RNA polymerase sigma-70 factor (ECF subfamily)